MHNTLADRVGWLCGCVGGSREDLSTLCGFAPSTLGFYARDQRTRGSIESGLAIARTFGCNLGWLLEGESAGAAPTVESVLDTVESVARAAGSDAVVDAVLAARAGLTRKAV